MNHSQVCFAGILQCNTWDNYWEGPLRRDNPNLGQVSHRSILAMGAIGISPRLNLLAMVPYISSRASQGSLAGQQGMQDLSVWLKYRALDSQFGHGKGKGFLLLGSDMPVSDYVPDFLPMSIGLQARTFSLRSIFDYWANNGLYLTLRGGYTLRSNITIDRDAYQANGKLYFTNTVALPQVADVGALVGWRKGAWVSAFTLDYTGAVSGDDIRPNDMPFPTNRMLGTSLGILGKYQGKHWGITLSGHLTVQGRNIGQNQFIQLGGLYLFQTRKAENLTD